MGSPYPLHYTLRWPFYYMWPSTKNHSRLDIKPIEHDFIRANSNDVLRVFFCGDIMLTQHDRIPILHSEVRHILNTADLFIGNCEAPVGVHAINPDASYHLIYHMPREFLKGIMDQLTLSPHQWVLSVANNHAGDKGEQAFLDSIHTLKEMGITPVGQNNENQLPVAIIKHHGVTLGIAAWTHWMNREVFSSRHQVGRHEQVEMLDWKRIKHEHQLDTLIGLPHWEYEFQHFPKRATRHIAKQLIESSGFNALIGAHPHTLQPMEWMQGGICQYSLGNFCGLGLAWPVRLIPILEMKIGKSIPNKGKIIGYKIHTFAQINQKNRMDILPLAMVKPNLKEKLIKRLNLVFKAGRI